MASPLRLAAFCLVIFVLSEAAAFPLPSWTTGIREPPSIHQRYRRHEYPSDKPFFQWWYFCAKDLETNRYWFWVYATIDSPTGSWSEGAIVIFGEVDKSSGNTSRLFRYEKFPLSAMDVKGNFSVTISPPDDNGAFRIEELPSDPNGRLRLRLTGRMTHPSNVWFAQNISNDTPIIWNVTLERQYGWYGQHAMEVPDHLWGDIMWNTYAHTSLVEGTIQIGTNVNQLVHSPRFRIYGDMNWGIQFPQPPSSSPKSLDYAWGWYSFVKPSADGNMAKDIGIVAGTGLTEVGFPFYSMLGQFADVRLGALSADIDFVEIGLEQLTPFAVNVSLTTDGSVSAFRVDRSAWTQFSDEFGTALIPLQQIVTLGSSHYTVVMNFTSALSDYNRLPFPLEGSVCSDFEALGVHVELSVSDAKSGKQLLAITTESGGLEFGYRVPIQNFPPKSVASSTHQP
eukprot:gnl/Spiro4/7251_TR3790_c0_g1_i2.p1 gnl/Spiro4/7251_TR3790_c0_g1~~gnl/Spiro4/7251_TR3790_c0_g1_i2.p1  ORF type:complete len:465 (-),score=81.46 gnl/Spiro4/7251_TR3790_c0_g1_i2:85-1443(-)